MELECAEMNHGNQQAKIADCPAELKASICSRVLGKDVLTPYDCSMMFSTVASV
jgi:hypothetical protein